MAGQITFWVARRWPNLIFFGLALTLCGFYFLHMIFGSLTPLSDAVLYVPKFRRHLELLADNSGSSMAEQAKDLYFGICLVAVCFALLTPYVTILTKRLIEQGQADSLVLRVSLLRERGAKLLFGIAAMLIWLCTSFLTSIPPASDHQRIFRLPANLLVVVLDAMCVYFLFALIYGILVFAIMPKKDVTRTVHSTGHSNARPDGSIQS